MRFEGHPFTLRQLQYALAVAETLSFRRAAELCHVSQPSLSAQLSELEDQLGVRLFERDNKRVLITAPGRALLERARAIALEADDLLELAKRSKDALEGPLAIGVIPTISPYLLPKITPVLRRTYPKLVLRWVEDKTEVLVKELHRGALDAALLALEADLGEVDVAVIKEDQFLLAVPKDHPLGAGKERAKLGDLKGEDVLLLDDGHCLRDQALAYCTKAKARELEFRATSLPTLVQMVAGGAGVTLLPELAAPAESKRAALTLRPFADPAPHRTLALIWRKRAPFAPALKKLAATIEKNV